MVFVVLVVVVVCGVEDIYYGQCSALVNTIAAFELCFVNPKMVQFFF